MSIKKFAALLLAVVLSISIAAGCANEKDGEYAHIIDTNQVYSYAMSRAGGLFLVPVLGDIESMSYSCDKGALFSFSGALGEGAKELELGSGEITVYEDDTLFDVYWSPEPISEDGVLQMTEAVITIRAKLSDGCNVYQVVNVVVDGIYFTLADTKEGE